MATASLLASLLAAAPVVADEAAKEAGDAAGEATEVVDPAPLRRPKEAVEEIKVTGRRREQTIFEAPATITAFSPTDLEDKEIRSVQDLERFVPNLQFDQAAGDQNAARAYLRGIGNGDPIISDEAGVGITVDDVFLPRAAGTLVDLADIDRVEVLSGPQATLYGKNTVGGIVRILTKKPDWTRTGSGEVRIGNYQALNTRFMINTPIIDELLAMRVNFGSAYNEGYVKNVVPGIDRTQQTRSLRGQIQFLYTPTEDLEVRLKAYHENSPNSGYTPKCLLLGGQADTGLNGLLFGSNGREGSFNEECGKDSDRDVRKVATDTSLRSELKTYGSSMALTYDSNSFTLRSVTAWNRNKTRNAFDGDATALAINQPLPGDSDRSTQDSITQEFNLQGAGMGGRLSWTAGVFGLVEKNQDQMVDSQNPATIGNPITADFGGFLPNIPALGGFAGQPVPEDALPAGVVRITNGASACLDTPRRIVAMLDTGDDPVTGEPIIVPIPTTACTREFEGVRTQGFRKANVTSYAAYGQFDFELTDRLEIGVGARYTHERKRVARLNEILPADVARVREPNTIARGNRLNDFEFSERFGGFSPSAQIKYRVSDEINTYVTVGRGFKSGGFNGRGVGDTGEVITYDEEVVTNYEAGIRSRWFDSRLSLNLTAFSQKYRDIQLPNLQINADSGRITVVTDNVGRAQVNGFEVQATGSPVDNLTLTLNLGFLKGRYEKIKLPDSSVQLVGANDNLVGAPAFTGSVSASYLTEVGTLGDLRSTVTWSHSGKKDNDASNTDAVESSKRGLLSARFALELADGKTRISVFGNNLLDREYVATGLNVVRNALLFYGPPRTYGVEITRDFDW